LILLVTAGAFSVFVFGNNTYRAGNDQHKLQTEMRFALEELTDDIRYATELAVYQEGEINIEDLLIKDGADGAYKNVDLYETYIFFYEDEIVRLRRNSKRSLYFNTDEINPLKFTVDNDRIDYSIEGLNDTGKKSYQVDVSMALLNINDGIGKLEGKDGTDLSGEGIAVKYSTPNDFLAYSQAPDIRVVSSTDESVVVIFDSKITLLDETVESEGQLTRADITVEEPDYDEINEETTVTITINDPTSNPMNFIDGDRINLTVEFSANMLDWEDPNSNFEMNYSLVYITDEWSAQ